MDRLIVKLSSIGDVIHTIPAFRALRGAAPGDFIAWLVEEPAFPLVRDLPDLDRAILLPRRTWLRRWRSAREAVDLFSGLRRMGFDQVIDFQGLARSAIVSVLSGASERIGFADGREGSAFVYNRRVQVRRGGGHAIDRNLALARALGGIPGPVDMGLTIPRVVGDNVRQLIREQGLSGGFVILHPSAGRATNRYPPDRFAAVGDRVVRELGLSVAVTGPESDRERVGRTLASMEEEGVDLSGRLDLWGMAALSAESLCFVGGDTGPLHLAVAAGAPVVAIYGGADPRKTGPYGSRTRLVRSRFPCGACYRRSCPDLPCMAAIPPEEVFRHVAETARLEESRRSSMAVPGDGGARA